jgi:hypothetical protein
MDLKKEFTLPSVLQNLSSFCNMRIVYPFGGDLLTLDIVPSVVNEAVGDPFSEIAGDGL